MIYSVKHRLKALVLLIVFSMNTLVGVACSLSFGVNLNLRHHHEETESTEALVHHHDESKGHMRYEKKEGHKRGNSDQEKPKGGKNNCCKDQVMKFLKIDKSVPGFIELTLPVFSTLFASPVNSDVSCPAGIPKDIKQFVRSYHPPIPDIYIAIQSFRI